MRHPRFTKMLMHPLAVCLISAALFGAATPASKALLGELAPFQLAGLLYLGAALGVAPAAMRGGRIRLPARSDRRNRIRLLGAIVVGGIAGPVLMLLALRAAEAASVALWLNLEVVATALLGVFVFREHLGWPGWLGAASAIGGGVILSLASGPAGIEAGLLVALACLCWGLDNHLTALIDGITPSESTFWKGLVAGATNLAIGLALDPTHLPALASLLALLVGAFAFGVSIVLYIGSAQALGATRAQVVFSSAPFFGVLLSVVALSEVLTGAHLAAGALFAAGVGLFVLERHAHAHAHAAMEHEHSHRHDDGHHLHEHHGHEAAQRHSHRHRHDAVAHSHPHWPDLHHRHRHSADA